MTLCGEIGQQAEKKACAFLKKQGLKLVTRNFKTRLGEIDLIMQDGRVLVFIEVRYRRYAQGYATSVETVTYAKQKRLIRTALIYLQRIKKHKPFESRFDIIGMRDTEKINWIKNAFMMQS
jgi:putative endonuclease